MWAYAALAAVVLGCLLRLHRFIDNPALWMDEAFLSINIIEKSFSGLFGSLQFLQSAPPGFLVVEKAAETALGDAEWSLRLVPAVASLASVPLFGYVAWRVVAPPAAVLAITLFATGEPLLLRAAEVKHYSTDIAMTTLLLALYLWAIAGPPERRLRRIAVLGLVVPIALSLSFPAAFVVAGLVAALAVHVWEARERTLLLGTLVISGLALVTFAAVYAVASPNASRVRASVLGDQGIDLSVGRLKTIENAWWTFINPGGFDNETNSLAALLAGFGLFAFARRGALDRLVLFTLPLLLAVVGDLIGRYPLGGRFSVFLVPLLLVLVARGSQAVVAWSRRPLVVATGIGIFLLASPLALAAYHVVVTPARGDLKPLLRQLVVDWKNGDTLYVFPETQYQLRYYTECDDCSVSAADFPWPSRLAPPSHLGEQYAPALESIPPAVIVGSRSDPEGDLRRLSPRRRIWLLTSIESLDHNGADDESLLVSELERDWGLVKVIRARSARLYLFDRKP